MGTTAYGGKGSKGRAVSGKRPTSAASCKTKRTKVSYQPPPPPLLDLPAHAGGPGSGTEPNHPPFIEGHASLRTPPHFFSSEPLVFAGDCLFGRH